MRVHTRWLWISAGALAATGIVSLRSALAGNAVVSPCEYFSVELLPGDSLAYSGSTPGVTLLVDDVTYSVQLDPCELYERCAFFSESEITSDFQDQDIGADPNAPIIDLSQIPSVTGIGPHGGDSISWSLVWSWRGNTVLAKGAYLCAELREDADEEPSQAFDAVSHNVYGEFLDKLKLNWEFYRDDVFYLDPFPHGGNDPEQGGGPEHTGNTATSAVAHSQARTEAAGMAAWATRTSASRRFQTPQIVQPRSGARVTFALVTSGSGFASYARARAFVRGRVVSGGAAPVECADVTVQQP